MALTLETVARNAAADAVVDLVDAGTGAGMVRIRDGATLLCEIDLDEPAFGAAATGTATAAGLPNAGVGVAAGDADNFQILDGDATLIYSGTVTSTAVGTGDMLMDNVNIAVDQAVNINTITYTQPA